jgi:hypothetical protein
MILSILIPTLESRIALLDRLQRILYEQIEKCHAFDKVEILTDSDNGGKIVGEKRNHLLQAAKGKYVVGIDDDDLVTRHYIYEILEAAKKDPDSMGINGTMVTHTTFTWDIRQGNPYVQRGNHYLRYPNHITPIRTSIAKQFKFPHQNTGEDYIWATKLRDSGLLKTEVIIKPPMYIYKPSMKN